MGGRLESQRNLISGGPSAVWVTRFGQFAGGAAISHADSASGHAYSGSYAYSSPLFGFSIYSRRASDNYANLSLLPSADRPLKQLTATAGFNILKTLASIEVSRLDFRDSARASRVAITLSKALRGGVNVAGTLGRQHVLGRDVKEAYLSLTYTISHNTLASSSFSSFDQQRTEELHVQRALPTGPGWGYEADGRRTLGTSIGTGTVDYRSTIAQMELAGASGAGTSGITGQLSGGILEVGNSVHFSLPIQQGFAIVHVGVPNVRVYGSNLLLGRTNAAGDLVVPNLIGYYANDIRIDDTDIPIDYKIEQTERTISLPVGAGAIIDFGVKRVHGVTGNVKLESQGTTTIPAYGTARVRFGTTEFTSPIGEGGEFYFDQVAVGSNVMDVDYGPRHCTISFTVRGTNEPVENVGTIICRAR
jgi:outer membrane usher protein